LGQCADYDLWKRRTPIPVAAADRGGQAIAGYLYRDRARCFCRSLFIRDYAPLVGFSVVQSIAKIVQRALKKAGVESARKGAHLLRHSLATDMPRKGASLQETGVLLRHKSPGSTAIYAKIELDVLKALASLASGSMGNEKPIAQRTAKITKSLGINRARTRCGTQLPQAQ
jgi:integrase